MAQDIYEKSLDSTVPLLRAFLSFFYELGMSGISNGLWYTELDTPKILWLCTFSNETAFSPDMVLPLLNPLVGEKLILCTALPSSIAYALLYSLARASWNAVIYENSCDYAGTLLECFLWNDLCPCKTFYICYYFKRSKLNQSGLWSVVTFFLKLFFSSTFVFFVEFMLFIWILRGKHKDLLLGSLVLVDVTSAWFLSPNALFNCTGFSIICASVCLVISLCYACIPSLETSSDP
ncbi:hypothetical protein RJ641_036425 [Dillenia turbinata]|uniref:Uncharacterized protein n=1 Tax=Dillenia turbinata TaxID=194707 RepID=A0AAN8VP69_9MAGN